MSLPHRRAGRDMPKAQARRIVDTKRQSMCRLLFALGNMAWLVEVGHMFRPMGRGLDAVGT